MKLFGFNPSSWFNNIWAGKAGKDNIYYLTDPNLGDLLSVFNGGYSETNMMLLAQTVPELFFVINAIAGRVKNGVFKLVDKDGNPVEDNKLWNKIKKRPNWQYSFSDFVWHAVAHRLITGNRYGYAYTPSTMTAKHANIQALWLLPPHYVFLIMKTPRPSYLTTIKASDYVDYFHYTGGDTMSEIKPESVVHDIYMKMGDSTDIVTGKGISPFKAGEKALMNLVAVYAARHNIYLKRGPGGIMVSVKSDAGGNAALTPTQKKEVLEDMTGNYGTGYGQSPFAITNQPIKWEKTGSTINELEPFKETRASAEALCLLLNIPVSLIADSKFANLDISERNLYDNVIYSEANAFCEFITTLGKFDELEMKVVVAFDHISALQDDAAKAAKALKDNVQASSQLYDDGHITQNELREIINQEPIDGGDDYIDEAERLAGKFPPQPVQNIITPENVDGNTTGDVTEEAEQASGKAIVIPRRKKGIVKLFGKKRSRKKVKSVIYGTS